MDRVKSIRNPFQRTKSHPKSEYSWIEPSSKRPSPKKGAPHEAEWAGRGRGWGRGHLEGFVVVLALVVDGVVLGVDGHEEDGRVAAQGAEHGMDVVGRGVHLGHHQVGVEFAHAPAQFRVVGRQTLARRAPAFPVASVFCFCFASVFSFFF